MLIVVLKLSNLPLKLFLQFSSVALVKKIPNVSSLSFIIMHNVYQISIILPYSSVAEMFLFAMFNHTFVIDSCSPSRVNSCKTLMKFSEHRIEYPLGGSSKKGSQVYFLLQVFWVVLLFDKNVVLMLLW